MKTNYLNTFLKRASMVALALASFTAVAQEEEETKKFNISGSVDAYFRSNLTTKNVFYVQDGADVLALSPAPSTSFVDRSGFSVGMANLIASYGGEKAGFVVDLVYGPRGSAALSDGVNDNENIVNQAYVYLNASDAVTLTLGRFNTFLGYEVISPVGNFNYSTSYMFTNGPFSHNGLKADFAIDDNWSAMLAVMNPTDVTFGNPADSYVIGAQVGYSDDSGSAYLNFRYGNEGIASVVGPTFQADLTTGWDVSEDFYLGLNATVLSNAESNDFDAENGVGTPKNGFYGVALYPQYSVSESFALGLRGEYFARTIDVDGVDAPNVIATTLTGQYKVGALTIIPELRLDATDEDNPIDGIPYVDADGEATGSIASFVLGAVYSF